MKVDKDQKWIFAATHENTFYPEHFIDLEDLDNLEYADVRDGKYQLWNWPSGDVYEIIPDREVASHEEYSVPYTSKGTVWLPVIKKIGEDKSKVNEAMHSLSE